MTGADLDPAIIERRLVHMMDAVHTLRSYQGISFEKMAADPKIYWAVQHGLQLCVQSVLDVASHCVAVLGDTVPDEYRDNILLLAPLGILPDHFARRIAPMAGFRNILVHQYIDVDLTEVYRILNDQLDDFVKFAQHITEFLDG